MKSRLIILGFLVCICTEVFAYQSNKPLLGKQINWAHSLSKGLVGCWVMNEGSGGSVFDLSGNNNNGTLGGDTFWGVGRYGSALDFDSNGDYVEIPDSPTLDVDYLTVVGWMKFRTVGDTYNMLASRDSGSAGDRYWSLGTYYNPNMVGIVWLSDDTIVQVLANTTTLTTGVWYHFAMTYDGTTLILYLNGQVEASQAESGTIKQGAEILYLGAQKGIYNNYQDGQIDHIIVWNRALTASEIQQLYEKPFCMFDTTWDWLLYGGIAAPAAAAGQVIFINMN